MRSPMLTMRRIAFASLAVIIAYVCFATGGLGLDTVAVVCLLYALLQVFLLLFLDAWNTVASNAGGLSLSLTHLGDFCPYLATGDAAAHPREAEFFANEPREYWLKRLDDHLKNGDCRAAVVIGVTDDFIMVAAYSDDFDAVVILGADTRTSQNLMARHRLQAGTRLIVSNTFTAPQAGKQLQDDIVIGKPRRRSPWIGVWPLIVDFLCEPSPRLQALHASISEAEWKRVQELADATMTQQSVKIRSTHPFNVREAGRLITRKKKGA